MKITWHVLAGIGCAAGLIAQTPPVTTGQYNNSRNAWNASEKILTVSNVGPTTFGKIGSFPVDGIVFAQPLYMPAVSIQGTPVNVLYVATMNNTVYAFNADDATQPPLWSVNLAPAVPSGWAGPCPDLGTTGSQLGILSTPVIDPATSTIYVVAATPAGTGNYVHMIFALDLATGQPKMGGSTTITASVPGTGWDEVGGIVPMNTTRHMQRPALLEANGTIYAGFGSCGPDLAPYHGWVVGYNSQNIQQQVEVYNTTANGGEGAVWQSGRGIAADAQGSLYFMTGNAPVTTEGNPNLGESFVKMSGQGTVTGWFTPANLALLDNEDLDLGSSGPILLPRYGQVVGGGKYGVLFTLPTSGIQGQVTVPRQRFQATPPCGTAVYSGCYQIRGIAFWGSLTTPKLYIWGVGDVMRAFNMSSKGYLATTPASMGSEIAGYPGGFMTVSSNADTAGTAIVWAMTLPGTLHAYDARDVAVELWNSDMNPSRDGVGTATKFVPPMVVGGKAYVATTSGQVLMYGIVTASAGRTAP